MSRLQKDIKKKRKRVGMGVRRKLQGLADKPRLAVFRSHRHFYCQAIDDIAGKTLASVSSLESTLREETKGSKVEKAKVLGLKMATRLKELGIERAVLDRSWYRYHGCVKTFADNVREGGIRF